MAEDMLMDPLILAGDRVVPLVIREVKNPQMPRRRYAISFLGNGAYREALPVLQHILLNEGEVEYFRGDALLAIFRIDPSSGDRHANKFRNRKDYLGQVAKDIIQRDDFIYYRRSYQNALIGKHE